MSLETSRRGLVAASGAGVVGLAGVAGTAPAAFAVDYTPGSWPGTKVLPARQRHLVSRFSYGVTQQLAKQVRASGGAEAWFEKQLRTAYDGSADGLADWWPDLHLDAPTVWDRQVQRIRGGYRVMYDYGRRQLMRRMISPRPVLEVMTEFWENLLHVPANGDSQFTWRAAYGELVREHALGRFDQLLPKAITHPAMMIFLTGANSTKDHPNENLARELLELHTVGVGVFDEDDVKNAALVLTGFRIANRGGWTASYDPAVHYTGPVQVLGFSHANADPDGRGVTRELLRYLARHPSTARRIARRLARTFVSDNPSEALVRRLAKVYLASNTAIAPVLRALVASPEFAASADQKVRDPGQDVVATFRVLGARIDPPQANDDASAASQCVHIADTLGLAPMAWPLPDGSPVQNEAWSSPARAMASFDAHWKIAGRNFPTLGVTYKTAGQWLPAPSITLRDLVDHLSRTLHHRRSTSTLLQACCEAVELPPDEVITDAHPLVVSRMPRLLVVFLDHPTHLAR